jgi:hypothetical protein
MSTWLEYFLVPLLKNPLFNNNRTLVQLTFDENETYDIQNNIYTVLLGGAVPEALRGTNDTTFYTHYSMLSSVQNNWNLPSLGRQDTNKTVAAVWDFQAKVTNYTNAVTDVAARPLLNLTGIYPGALNPELWVPIPAPNTEAAGAGAAEVSYNKSATDANVKAESFAPLNLTALGVKNEYNVNPNFTYDYDLIVNKTNAPAAANGTNVTTKGHKDSAAGRVVAGGLAVVVAVAGSLLL